MNHRIGLFTWFVVFGVTGCSTDEVSEKVAANAEQAWPDVPQVRSITPDELHQACFDYVTCRPEADAGFCRLQVASSAERAIPIDFPDSSNERAEFWTSCVLAAHGDCAAILACSTRRDSHISCEEDGCRLDAEDPRISCAGDVATVQARDTATDPEQNFTFTRDCSRAFAHCDPSSPTGCSDRGYTACPPGVSRADRCDGNVRLGCDHTNHVSYHDCERLGGTCGALPGKGNACSYPGDPYIIIQ